MNRIRGERNQDISDINHSRGGGRLMKINSLNSSINAGGNFGSTSKLDRHLDMSATPTTPMSQGRAVLVRSVYRSMRV